MNNSRTNLDKSISQPGSYLLLMNDLPMSQFLSVVFVLLLLMWVTIIVDNFIIPLPIVRQMIAFIFLTFIPGFLVLRCLKLHKLGTIQSLLYAVGLSLIVLMFSGFFINFLFPFLGILNPISIYPLLVTMSIIIGILAVIAKKMDTTWSMEIPDNNPTSIITLIAETLKSCSPITLFLLTLPFVAILGTFLVNFYQNTSLLWILLPLIVVIVILIGFDVIPKHYYPLIIFVMGLSLLFNTSLISMYLTGSDVHQEFHYANLVLESSAWDPGIAANVNAMLSVVMIAPIYSLFLNLEIGWVLKIIYPFLFSLLPLGMYQLFREQLGDKVGCISTIFLFSVGTFFILMLHVMRQQIAELFLILILLLMIDHTLDRKKRDILAIMFGSGLIVSHYGLAWMYIFIFSLTFLLLSFLNLLNKNSKPKNQFISANFVFIYIVINFIWYIYITKSTMPQQITSQFQTISAKFYGSFFQIQQSQPASILAGITTPLHLLSKYLHILPLLLIGIGILITLYWLLTNWKGYGFTLNKEFAVISISNFILLASGFVIPNLFMFSTVRVYHIVLIVLAPYTIIGGILLIKIVAGMIKFKKIPSENTFLKIFAIFFAVLLVINTSMLYEAAKDRPSSISLSQESVAKSNNIDDINGYYVTYFPEPELYSAHWINENFNNTKIVYGDDPSILMPLMSYGMIRNGTSIDRISPSEVNSYIYFRFFNVYYGKFTGPDDFAEYWNISEKSHDLYQRSTIYNNSFSKVLY